MCPLSDDVGIGSLKYLQAFCQVITSIIIIIIKFGNVAVFRFVDGIIQTSTERETLGNAVYVYVSQLFG
ncbi:hypothetical protein D3C73_1369840 [compost metagenome]